MSGQKRLFSNLELGLKGHRGILEAESKPRPRAPPGLPGDAGKLLSLLANFLSSHIEGFTPSPREAGMQKCGPEF